MAARYATNHQPQIAPVDAFFNELLPTLKGEELINSLRIAQSKLLENATLSEYLTLLNLTKNGITGYVNYTVPATIYAWLRYYGDYQKTISELVMAGGDTDTNAAIAGALAGLVIGCDKTPTCWIKGISDWPMSIKYINKLSGLLVSKKLYPNKILKNRPLNPLFLLVRNIIFLAVILKEIRAAATTLGVIPSAIDDAIYFSRDLFTVDDEGKVIPTESAGLDAKGNPLTTKAWLEAVREKAPHWFPIVQGSGAPGSGNGNANLDRSKMGAVDIKQYIETHGREAYLKLPK